MASKVRPLARGNHCRCVITKRPTGALSKKLRDNLSEPLAGLDELKQQALDTLLNVIDRTAAEQLIDQQAMSGEFIRSPPKVQEIVALLTKLQAIDVASYKEMPTKINRKFDAEQSKDKYKGCYRTRPTAYAISLSFTGALANAHNISRNTSLV